MKLVNDNFNKYIDKNEVYKCALNEFSKETVSFAAKFHDDPSIVSNWGHHYFCNDDGGRLVFDLNKPKEHVCCICKKVYTGKDYDGNWTYFYRNEAIVEALKAGTLYSYSHDKKYRDIAVKIIGFYSDNYSKFILHTKEDEHFTSLDSMKWGCGKIMPQGLNEAILGIRIVQTLNLIEEDETKDFISGVIVNLLNPMADLLKPQVDQIHNIRVWDLACIGAIALFTKNEELYDWCYNSEFGISAQLSKGVTKDGFWYEGSTHYNFFLLEGMVTLLMLSEVYNHPFKTAEKDIINHMLTTAYSYAFDANYFPNPNDGWPNLNLKTYSYIYHMAARVFGENSELGNIVKLIEAGKEKREDVPLSQSIYSKSGISLERLLFNTDFDYSKFTNIKRGNYNFKLSNFAMIRKGQMNLFMKYGLNGPSHAHPDILNIEVCYGNTKISRDISNAGYQSTLCNGWHRVSLSHNTVVCGGENITARDLGEAELKGSVIKAFHKNVYEGIDYTRTCDVSNDGFTDIFTVVSNNHKTKDYIFNVEAGFQFTKEVEYPLSYDVLGYSNNGYQYIKMLRKDDATKKFELSNGSVHINIGFEGSEDYDLYIMKTMDNPVSDTRITFLLRSKEEKPVFNMQINCKEL
jgi:hypothetical protein